MQIHDNYSLQSLNSFGVTATSTLFTKINSSSDIDALIDWRKANPNMQCLLIGGGSNLLFRNDFTGIAVAVRLMGKSLIDEDDDTFYVKAAGGENWHEFVCWTIDQGYAGLENLSLIPGTVGAAPMQNIGAYGVELGDRLHELSAVDLSTGKRQVFNNVDCQFAYRDSFFKQQQADRWLIESVTFSLAKNPTWVIAYAGVEAALAGQTPSARLISDTVIALRQSKLPDPAVIGNAGSFFKNPIMTIDRWSALKIEFPEIPGYPQKDNGGKIKTSAGWLIDQCNWKAYRESDAGVYEKHALVLVNYGGASGLEILALAEQIIKSVQKKFGVSLEPEPRIIS